MEDAFALLRKRREAESKAMGDIQVTLTDGIVKDAKDRKAQRIKARAKERSHRSYVRNREAVIARTIKWQQDHPDKVLQYQQTYTKKHSGRVAKSKKKLIANNREDVNARQRDWCAKNPDKVKKHNQSNYAKHGKQYAATARKKYHSMTPEQKAIYLAKKREYYHHKKEMKNDQVRLVSKDMQGSADRV